MSSYHGKLKKYSLRLVKIVSASENNFFKEHPEIIKRLKNFDANKAVSYIKDTVRKTFAKVSEMDELKDFRTGTIAFDWDDCCHSFFRLGLSSGSEFSCWMDLDHEDLDEIDFDPVIRQIFNDIKNPHELLQDELENFNNFYSALLEAAVLELIEENDLNIPRIKETFQVTTRIWHDSEEVLVYHSNPDMADEVYRDMDNLPEIPEKKEVKSDEIKIGRKMFTFDSERVNAFSAGVTKIPDEISRFTKAVEMHFYDNKIKEIPESLYTLTGLKYLLLKNNKIAYLSPLVGNLVNLERLEADNNLIEKIPEEIADLKQLDRLDFQHNRIETIPESIKMMDKLSSLNLSYNNISELPQLPLNITDLGLNNNKLSELPKSLGMLSKLESLGLNENRFTEVPPVIAELKNLERLSLGENPITDLPDFLLDLPKIIRIDIRPNRFSIEKRAELREKFGDKLFVGYDCDEKSFMN